MRARCPKLLNKPKCRSSVCFSFLLFFLFWFPTASWCAAAQTNTLPQFQVKTAREYLQSLCQMIPLELGTNAGTFYTQARLESHLGDKREAERLAREALEMQTNRADIAVFLADILIREDRMDEAAILLRKAVQADPAIDGGQRRLGMVLERLGDRRGAGAAFMAAVSVNPKDGTARMLLGKYLMEEGNLKEAVTNLELACRLDPESANPYYPLFQAESKLGNREAADKALKKFKELRKVENTGMGTLSDNGDSDNEANLRSYTAGFHTELAELLLKQGQEVLAESHLRQAIQIAPKEPQAYQILANWYLHKGKLPEARSLFEELTRWQPKDVSVRVNLGTLLLQLKDYPAAVEQLNSALELEPTQAQALNNLAQHYLNTRQHLPEALVLCQRLVACDPQATSYDLLGHAFYSNGKTNEALKALGTALEKDPGNAVYRQRYERLQKVAGVKP
jgi:tetratricopeptide (TPR) repeat protein